MNIPGLDPAEFVLRQTSVGPGVNLLLVVAGLEGREDEVAVVHHLEIQQSALASQEGHNAPLFVSVLSSAGSSAVFTRIDIELCGYRL